MRLRNIVLVLAIALLLAVIARLADGATLTCEWDSNSEPDLAGYNIFWGTASGAYGGGATVGPDVTVYQLQDLPEDTTHYVALTAFDLSENESDFSDEASATTLGPLGLLRVEAGPSIVEAVAGGGVSVYVRVTNPGSTVAAFDVWTEVTAGGELRTAWGPKGFTLEAAQSKTRRLRQKVPDWVPEGTYEYRVCVGRHPEKRASAKIWLKVASTP